MNNMENTMKSFVRLSLLLVLILPKIILSQTVLIDSLQEGGFNLGTTFAANGWNVLNGSSANKWYVGSVPTGFNGNSAYISNNGGTNWSYNNGVTSATVHFYRDITLPQGINYLELSFLWANMGETSPNDVLMISVASTTYTPSQTNHPAIMLSQPAQTLAVLQNKNTPTKHKILFHPQVVNTCNSSATIRLIFSYRFNNSSGSNPPAAVDNISLLLHANNIGVTGGEFTVNNTLPDSPNNFSSLTKAIVASNAASQCVMTDSIILNLPGDLVFMEDLPFINFNGSPNASLILRKSTGGKLPVVRPTGSNWDRDFGIGLSGSSYVSINNIEISVDPMNSNVEFGYYIKPSGPEKGSNNIQIIDGAIILNKNNNKSKAIYQTTDLNINGFSITAQSGTNSFNKFKGLIIENVVQGIVLQGTYGSYFDENNEIGASEDHAMLVGGSSANNIGGSTVVFGVYASIQKNITLNKLTIQNLFTSGSNNIHGVFLSGCEGNININQTKIASVNNNSTNAYGIISGIYISSSYSTSTSYNIKNCFVADLNTSYISGINNQFIYGVFLNHSGSVSNVFANSISISPSSKMSSAGIYAQIGVFNLRNNIIVNNAIGTSSQNVRYGVYANDLSSILTSNHNNIKIDPTGINDYLFGFSNGSNYNSLVQWKNASGFDLNSSDLDPDFVSNTDLHIAPNSFKFDRKAEYIPGLNKDIDDMLIDTLSPDIGADDHMPISNGKDIGIYSITGIDNLDCFSENEQIKILLTNTSIHSHDFSLSPVEIQINYSGSYSGSINFNVANGVIGSYKDSIINIPEFLNFSGGGTINFSATIILQDDVNSYNNNCVKSFNQETINSTLIESFNTATNLPVNWKFNSGWEIYSGYNTLSKCVRRSFTANSSSEIILPAIGPVQQLDSFSFDLMADFIGMWKSVEIYISTDCGNTYMPFDTMQSTEYSNVSKWHHYETGISNFLNEIIKIKLIVKSSSSNIIMIDNFNVSQCNIPPQPTNLVLTPLSINSISVSFTASNCDGYLIVKVPTGQPPCGFPQNGKVYNSSELLGSGTVVASGQSISVIVGGLAIATTYEFYIFPYNGIECAGGPIFNSPIHGSQTTNSCSGSGIFKIGSSNDDFTSISSALEGLANIGIKDSVIFELQPDYIPETKWIFGSIGCNDSTHNLIIRPSTEVVAEIALTTSTGTVDPIFDFRGGSGIIIDGRPGGIGNSKLIKIKSGSNTAIKINNFSKNIVFKNLKIEGNNNSTINALIVFLDCNSVTFDNNDLGSINGFSKYIADISLNPIFNVIFRGNNFINFSYRGIYIWDCTNCILEYNSFYFTLPLVHRE